MLELGATHRGSSRSHVHSSPLLGARYALALSDIWSALTLLWIARLVGGLDPAEALLGLLTVAALSPTWKGVERMTLGGLDDAATIMVRGAGAYAATSAVTALTGIGDIRAALFLALVLVPVLICMRSVAYRIVRSLRAERQSSTIVVGGGEVTRRFIGMLAGHPRYGMTVVGVVDDDPLYDGPALGAPVLGRFADLSRLIDACEVDSVLISFGANDVEARSAVRAAINKGITVWAIPRLFEFGGSAPGGDHVHAMPIFRLADPARLRRGRLAKRIFDVVVVSAALILLAPVMAVIGALVYLGSGRPILLRQERIGEHGRSFGCLKFRTMTIAEPSVEGTEWTADRDRITKIGRRLRDFSLDELPQLFNVLKGDMSLVGPRPERPYFVNLFGELYTNYGARHRMPAGITGFAQVNGLRGDTSIEDRVIYDNYYIENWSAGEDLKIMLRTIGTLGG
jgi:exopolysaccharide biosynthesis polyprenyl glycosylphosphotransferase